MNIHYVGEIVLEEEKCEMARTALLSFHKYHDFWSSQNLPFTKWLQTAVSKPNDGISMNILAEGGH